MIKDIEKFCKELKDFLKSKGLTQQQVADLFGVSQSYIGSLLNGTNRFGKKVAKQWSEQFGISEAWLLTGEGAMFPGVGVMQNNQNGDNYNGAGFTVHKSDAEYISLLKKKDEQIDRLLSIIENMQINKV